MPYLDESEWPLDKEDRSEDAKILTDEEILMRRERLWKIAGFSCKKCMEDKNL